LPVYAAGEAPIENINSETLVKEILKVNGDHVLHVDPQDDGHPFLPRLQSALAPGDVLLTLGAGDVWKLGELFLNRPNARHSPIETVTV